MRKIFLICHSSEKAGGGEDDFLRLIIHLSGKYLLYLSFPEGPRTEIYSKYAEKFIILPSRIPPLYGLKLRFFIHPEYLKYFFKITLKLSKFYFQNRDIEFTIINSSVCYVEALITFLTSKPYMIFVREKLNPKIFRSILYRFYKNTAFRIIVISNFLRNVFLQTTKASNLVVQNSPIDEKVYENISNKVTVKNKSDDVFSFCLIGPISHIKGQDIFIRALQESNINIKVNIYFVGRYNKDLYYLELIKNIKKLSENITVNFEGELDKEETIGFIKNSDCIAICSREEGASLVFTEALFFNKVLISSKVGDIADMIIDEETGLLFEPEDHVGLSNQVQKLIYQKEIYNNILKNVNGIYWKFFDQTKNFKKIEEIIEDAIRNNS